MKFIINPINALLNIFYKVKSFNFLSAIALRIYLAPIFILAGWHKLQALDNTAYYFGEMLGLPAPMLMATLAGLAEFIGGIALLIGLGVRFMVIPLMFTMIVAASTAHWENGWHALPETMLTVPWEWRTDLIDEAQTRKDAAKSILQQHGNYSWLTETGSFTVLKNGIEFSATYFIMLLVLFFNGAGAYLSLDYWIARKFRSQQLN